MVAVAGVPEAQVAVAVRICVLESLYVPVATKFCVAPLAMETVAGVTAIETRVAAVTVSVVMPTMAPLVAEIMVVPSATAFASPWEAAALEIVAVPIVADTQVAVAVRSCVVASL
jgi:hypothetical protein